MSHRAHTILTSYPVASALGSAVIAAGQTSDLYSRPRRFERARQVDGLHYRIELGFDEARKVLKGKTTITFSSLREGLATVDFDAETFRVERVEDGTGGSLQFEHHNGTLTIQLGRPLRYGEESSVTVSYAGEDVDVDPTRFGMSAGYDLGIDFKAATDDNPQLINTLSFPPEGPSSRSSLLGPERPPIVPPGCRTMRTAGGAGDLVAGTGSGAERARARLLCWSVASIEPSPGFLRKLGRPAFRMKQASQNRDTGHQPRARAREVAARVDNMDVAHLGQRRKLRLRELREGFLEVVTARHEDNDVRCGLSDLAWAQRTGTLAGLRQDIDAAGHRHHFGNPVTAGERRLEPFEAGDPWSGRNVGNCGTDGLELDEPSCDKLLRHLDTADGAPHRSHVLPHVGERMRVKRHDVRTSIERLDRLRDVTWCHRTNVAEILGENDVGGELSKRVEVDAVGSAALGDELSNLPIDGRRIGPCGQPRVNDYALLSGLRWIVALEGDAD